MFLSGLGPRGQFSKKQPHEARNTPRRLRGERATFRTASKPRTRAEFDRDFGTSPKQGEHPGTTQQQRCFRGSVRKAVQQKRDGLREARQQRIRKAWQSDGHRRECGAVRKAFEQIGGERYRRFRKSSSECCDVRKTPKWVRKAGGKFRRGEQTSSESERGLRTNPSSSFFMLCRVGERPGPAIRVGHRC